MRDQSHTRASASSHRCVRVCSVCTDRERHLSLMLHIRVQLHIPILEVMHPEFHGALHIG